MIELTEIDSAIEKNKSLEKDFLDQLSQGVSGLDSILSLQPKLSDLYELLASLMRKKLCLSDYDKLHEILNKWDSLYSYYNLDFGNVHIERDGSFSPEFLVKNRFKQYIRGRVIKCAMQKTVTVLVEGKVTHHPTGKKIPRSTRYLVHDPHELCKEGDEIIACETKPISKQKNHVFFRRIYS